jgi:anaerobic selenocysteine-containing dehydrogenase
MVGKQEVQVIRTICHNCHSLCGVLVTVKDGVAVKIEGDPEHPLSKGFLCVKGLSHLQLVYHPERIKYPLKRIGERGEGKWQRTSWNEALDAIAHKFSEIIERYGPHSIAFCTGGNTRMGAHAGFALMRSIGSVNASWTDAPWCWGPFPIAEMCTYGGLLFTEARVDAANSKCLLVWGSNPINTYTVLGRELIHAIDRGAKLIVVDPRFTPLASKADVWLQIRPGTDAALALGMLNIIINEGLYDKEFVSKWCVGFDELKKRVDEYPVEKVAKITWLSADDIVRAARLYATNSPGAAIFPGVALEIQYNSVQTLRAIACLQLRGI